MLKYRHFFVQNELNIVLSKRMGFTGTFSLTLSIHFNEGKEFCSADPQSLIFISPRPLIKQTRINAFLKPFSFIFSELVSIEFA